MYVKTILFRGGILQECGILLGGCLTVKNYWELLTGDDGVGFSSAEYLNSRDSVSGMNPYLKEMLGHTFFWGAYPFP